MGTRAYLRSIRARKSPLGPAEGLLRVLEPTTDVYQYLLMSTRVAVDIDLLAIKRVG